MVASPNDVQAERDALPSVIEEVNRGVAAELGLHLVLSRWETDTHPGFHSEGPQGLIDPILNITDCDLLIGIFWKRFGTPTADGKTGTEHELSLAHEARQKKGSPQIFVYFNLKPYLPKSKAEADQWGQVIEFKDKFPKEALWWPYKGKAEFEKLVRNHLVNYIRNLTYVKERDSVQRLRSSLACSRVVSLGVSVSSFSNNINQRVEPLIRVNLGISKSFKPFFVAFKSYFVAHLGIHQDLVLFAELTAGAQTCLGE